jgi:hypothetical protein
VLIQGRRFTDLMSLADRSTLISPPADPAPAT